MKREISRAYQSSQKLFRVHCPFFDPTWFFLIANDGIYLFCSSIGAFVNVVVDHFWSTCIFSDSTILHNITISLKSIRPYKTEIKIIAEKVLDKCLHPGSNLQLAPPYGHCSNALPTELPPLLRNYL